MIPTQRKVFQNLSLRVLKSSMIIVLVVALFISCSGFAFATPNMVTIWESGKEPIKITTTDHTVGRILSRNGIVLGEHDRVNYALTDEISGDAVIEIYRAVEVTIAYAGRTTVVPTTRQNVADVLEEAGIKIDEDDTVIPSPETLVTPGMYIQVSLTDVQEITVHEKLPFAVREVEDASLLSGERVVVQHGREGVKEFQYRITYKNGVEVGRELLKEAVLSEAVEEIVNCGTLPPPNTFEIGKIPAVKDFSYTKMEQFQATAYDLSFESCGKYPGDPYYGITSWGVKARYGVVAVDPKVIPYGTKMYIESADGQYVYGYAVAGDCGGAIKNKRIDLFYNTHSECMNFGRRTINVYFLDEPLATRDEVGR